MGSRGNLFCLDAVTGKVFWQRNLLTEYQAAWGKGTTPSPLVEGDLLIVKTGHWQAPFPPCVVALDKNTGKEVWHALAEGATYSSPIVLTAGGVRQLIVWTGQSASSLEPTTGKTWWRLPMVSETVVATPVCQGDLLLLSGLMLKLDTDRPAATVLWPDSRAFPRRTLSTTSSPLLLGGHVYSNKQGDLLCLDARTGKQVWQTAQATMPASGACIHFTRNGQSVFLFNDRGELILAHLTARGFDEIGRTRLLDPAIPTTVVYPAYANRHLFARNSKELLCVSLAAAP